MYNYPEVVARIVSDYLERVKLQLRLAPAREKGEFLAEIQSHVYEAYQQMPGDDEVSRILAVLRNLGEPADVVSDRLPGAMARSGSKRKLPLYVVGGIFIALFGIPLGFGGLGVLMGLLGALAGVMVAFYATAGSIALVGTLLLLLGAVRIFLPHLFERLVALGIIQMSAPTADFLDQFSGAEQGLLMMFAGCIAAVVGLGMLWTGRYLFRGLRFLFRLLFDRMGRVARGIRGKVGPPHGEAPRVSPLSFGADVPKGSF